MDRITPNWTWTLDSQKYPVYIKYLPRSPKFWSSSSTTEWNWPMEKCDISTIFRTPNWRAKRMKLCGKYRYVFNVWGYSWHLMSQYHMGFNRWNCDFSERFQLIMKTLLLLQLWFFYNQTFYRGSLWHSTDTTLFANFLRFKFYLKQHLIIKSNRRKIETVS